MHCPGERIDARAHILQVNQETIQAAQHLGRRLPRLTVQAIDRHIERLVATVRRLDHVGLLFAPQSVLRSEHSLELARKLGRQQITGIAKRTIDRGLVHEQAKASAAENSRWLSEAPFEADFDAGATHKANTSVVAA